MFPSLDASKPTMRGSTRDSNEAKARECKHGSQSGATKIRATSSGGKTRRRDRGSSRKQSGRKAAQKEGGGSRFSGKVFRSFESIEDWLVDPEWNPETWLTEDEARKAFLSLRDCAKTGPKGWRAKTSQQNAEQKLNDSSTFNDDEYKLDENKLQAHFEEARRKELLKMQHLDKQVRDSERIVEEALRPHFPERLLAKKHVDEILRPFSPPPKASSESKTHEELRHISQAGLSGFAMQHVCQNVEPGETSMSSLEQSMTETHKTKNPEIQDFTFRRYVLRRFGEICFARIKANNVEISSRDGIHLETIRILSDQGEVRSLHELNAAIARSDVVTSIMPKLVAHTKMSPDELWKALQ